MNPTVEEASYLLNGSQAWVRSLCQRNLIGDAWSSGRSRKTYVIVPGQLAEYMRIPEEELWRRLNALRKKESERHINGLLRENR